MTTHAYTEEGASSRTYYVPGGKFLAAQRIPPPEVVPIPQDSHQVSAHSHQSSVDSHQLLATIPSHLAGRIPPAGSRPRRSLLRALILDLCAWRALSAREIAGILHRRDPKALGQGLPDAHGRRRLARLHHPGNGEPPGPALHPGGAKPRGQRNAAMTTHAVSGSGCGCRRGGSWSAVMALVVGMLLSSPLPLPRRDRARGPRVRSGHRHGWWDLSVYTLMYTSAPVPPNPSNHAPSYP